MFWNDISPLLRATALLALFVLVTTTLSLAGDPSALTWTQFRPTTALPPRAGFATAYDPVSQKVVIFGGSDASGQQLNETWTFDGTTWAQVQTSVAPGARSAVAMAYDRKTHKLVLFGGFLGFAFLNDTWLWDGATSTWTQANPTTVPKGATNPMLFTDPANGRVDMFGGISDNWIVQNTWTWDGKDWTQQNPTTQPDVLYFTTGGFNPVLKEVVVFGGGSAGVDQSGTWAWTGTDWTQLTPAKSPARREQFGTLWDPTSRQFLIFGGDVFNSNTVYGDTWRLTGQ